MGLVELSETGATGDEPRAPTTERTERDLLAGLRAGEREAAERLVETTYEMVFASLVRLCGDRELARDLTQETYRRAWASLASFSGRARFSTWLYRIGYNTFLNHVRRPQLMRPLDPEHAETLPSDQSSPTERLARREVDQRLRRAVLALPEKLRVVVTARFWAEVPVSEIARLEGVTGPAVRKRLKKAIASIRDHLDREAVA